LKDPGKTLEQKRFALRYPVHLLEDLHMPLHVGDNSDRGGNDTQIRFFDRGSNMHRLRNSDMIARAGNSERFWLNDLAVLDTEQDRSAWIVGTVEEWATECLLVACVAYLVPGTDKRMKPDQKLGDEYQAANLPMARRRLCQARVRVASILNEAFGEN
jgi:nuclease S1